MEDNLPLPSEIWCEIFSYLDGKSKRSVAATCNHFLGILRGNEKTSGQVILKSITLKILSEKIESGEWNWDRWPCLKNLGIPLSIWKGVNPYKNRGSGLCANTALDPLKLMKFEQCPSLDRLLIFNCVLPMQIFTNVSARYGYARELCINPRSIKKNFSFEHLSHLHLDNLENIDCHTLRLIGTTAKQLCRLTILVKHKSCLHALLDKGLIHMFIGLKGSLKTVCLKLDYYNSDYSIHVQALLKSLNENCPSLQSIHINTGTGKAREFLKGAEGYYQYPPNLRDQVATKLHHISAFNRDSKNLTTVIVHTVTLKNGVYVLNCYGFTAEKQLL